MSAGALLRRARTRAGLTQAELAARAGVAQSVVSAYENGRRQPALSTLATMVAATGYHLDIRLAGPLNRLTGPLGRRVRRHRRELLRAAAQHDLTNVRIFGSVARGADRPDSDVDLLVDIPPGMSLVGLNQARSELEAILGAPVDLVPARSLKPDVAAHALAEAVPL